MLQTSDTSSAGSQRPCLELMATSDTVLPQNGLPITDIIVAHAYDSGLFGDVGAKHLCGHLTERVDGHLVDLRAHLLQRDLPIENQELFG